MAKREDFTGQVFGNRIIVKNECSTEDWTRIGKNAPSDIRKYRLSKCLNCGCLIPVLIKNVIEQPPKRCYFCSNIGNKNGAVNTFVNSWVKYSDYAIVNIRYKESIVRAYISIDDYENVSTRTWRVSKKKNKYYLVSGSKTKGDVVYLHRLILSGMDIPEGYEVDHIDGNSLNNRRENLRVVSRLENIQNTSVRTDSTTGIRGVAPNGHGKYTVDFVHSGERYYFKSWDNLEDAVYCRRILEEQFGLEILSKNPNAIYIDYPSLPRQREIREYILNKISRKRR